MARDDATKTTTTGVGSKPGTPADAKKRARRLIIWGAIGAVAALLLAGSLVYTEQSSFCQTCHEMDPYYEAWVSGPHAESAECIDCHVDPGVIAHLAHKPIALKEVWNHFFRDNRFPTYSVDLPDSRCARCHTKVPEKKEDSLFSHAKHQAKTRCKNCHTDAGHRVTAASLKAVGVLDPNAKKPIPAGMSPSSVVGHPKVLCQECHDQVEMKCSACHKAPHGDRGECSNCHQASANFGKGHPGGSNPDCAECHDAPSRHFGSGCAGCHSPDIDFEDATFDHPARVGEHRYTAFACVKCHPDGGAKVYCSCHKGNPPNDD